MTTDKLEGRKTLVVDGFLEEFEKDEIKSRVDIVALFNSFSVSLTAKGKGFTGRCPWHDDKEPSLSVDREKGLYHCFGCGESGDAFSLVEKMKGVGFREALTYLKASAGGSPSNGRKARKESPSPARQLPATGSVSASELSHILDEVASRYAADLATHPEARVYLASRGLDRSGLIAGFGLGYCAGGELAPALSEAQRRELSRLGLIRASGGGALQGLHHRSPV
jgi:DNA primase